MLAVAAAFVVLLGGCDRAGPQTPTPLRTPAAERASWPRSPAHAVPAVVERVVDGDTFVAVIGGRRDPVRVIGVDTPETVAPGRPVERYGKQASAFAERWLGGATVRLAGDVEPRDRYGRLLAYVWLPDGTFWNALLAAEGYAEQLTIPPNVAFAELFARLVAEARTRHHGLWAAGHVPPDRGPGARAAKQSVALAGPRLPRHDGTGAPGGPWRERVPARPRLPPNHGTGAPGGPWGERVPARPRLPRKLAQALLGGRGGSELPPHRTRTAGQDTPLRADQGRQSPPERAPPTSNGDSSKLRCRSARTGR